MTPIETPVGTLYEIPASGWVAVSFDRNLSPPQLQALRENWQAFMDHNPGMPKLIVLPARATICPIEKVPA